MAAAGQSSTTSRRRRGSNDVITFKRHPSRLSVRRPSRMSQAELNTALVLSVASGTPDEILRLLVAGASPDAKDSLGRPILQTVLIERGGDPEIVKLLLNHGACVDDLCPRTRQTSLHVAARKGFQVSLGFMLGQSVSIDCVDSQSRTPLMLSCRYSHEAAAKQLLQGGADPLIENNKGETALHEAVNSNSLTCAQVLLRADSQLLVAPPADRRAQAVSPMFVAAKNNQVEMLDLLLMYPCHVDDADDNETGRTALHWASFHNNTSAVARLLHLGADLRRRDADWATCFTLALGQGHREVLKLLITAGCDVTSTDRSFNTAMHIAACGGFSDVITLLADAGLDINLKGSGGMTPLMLCAWGGHVTATRRLLNLGANVDIVDRNHASALVHAVLAASTNQDQASRYLDVVKELTRRNSNLDVPANLPELCKAHNLTKLSKSFESVADSKNRLHTPLELAFFSGDKRLFKIMLKAGCDAKLFHCTKKEYKTVVFGSDPTWNHKQSSAADHMLLILKAHKQSVFSLAHLCRRPVLATLFSKNPSVDLAQLHLPNAVEANLEFKDLDFDEIDDNVNIILVDENKKFSAKVKNPEENRPTPRSLQKCVLGSSTAKLSISCSFRVKNTPHSSGNNTALFDRNQSAAWKRQTMFPTYIPREEMPYRNHRSSTLSIHTTEHTPDHTSGSTLSYRSSHFNSVGGSSLDIRRSIGIAKCIQEDQVRLVPPETPRVDVCTPSRIPIFTRSTSIRQRRHKKCEVTV